MTSVEPRSGLSASELDELAALEARTVAADGGRLKLGWSTLRSRSGDEVSDLLVRQDGHLVGFLGVYRHGPVPELAGMVDPDVRGRGHGAALLAAGLDICRDRGDERALLVVPRRCAAGRALADRRGGRLEHSEYALEQTADPGPVPDLEGLHVRPARESDRPAVNELITDGFGFGAGDGAWPAGTLVVERDGQIVATLVADRDLGGDPPATSIYGFVVASALRRRGIGRAVLGEVCRRERAAGIARVRLEVEVANERALGLYTSLGFAEVATEDYWELTTSAG